MMILTWINPTRKIEREVAELNARIVTLEAMKP